MERIELLPYYEHSLQPASKWAAILDFNGKSCGAVASDKEEAKRIVTEWVESIRSMHG